jgi:hypothetical protein
VYKIGQKENKKSLKNKFKVTRIAQGFEFGHGAISGQDNPDILHILDDTIQNSPAILIRVDRDETGEIIHDDGCGDGREVTKVFTRGKQFKHSLARPKVFGGAVTMNTAVSIGSGKGRGKSLNQVFEESADELQRKNIDFGAHTDELAHGDNCGCGAIDRAPEAITAAIKYEKPIRAAIGLLGVSDEGLDEVFDNFRHYVKDEMSHQTKYSGRQVIEKILDGSKVVKELGGAHQERRIVLNHVAGYTVNQRLIREATKGKAQVFAVDIWRLNDIALNLFKGEPQLQHKALLSELIYTLATAAVLTKGDLPVDMVEGEPDWDLAPAHGKL